MRRAIHAAVLCLLSAGHLLAQCPDGSPPPCRDGARRALPGNAWVVVPFNNVMRAADLDWLRDASINLLSIDLGRWTDITVVDDKRVADLLRARPASAAPAPLTLNDGLALARSAGAGRLVMGDYYKLGGGARLSANVFDVNTGRRLRSVIQDARSPDSLLTAFGPLARGVLDLPPPPDARLGAIGTTSVRAYQEYLQGQAALNRW